MDLPATKFIADPLHGAVSLAEHEVKLISTPYFQRLRWIKQLGVSFFVYPSSTHTRFSHSIGVCHVVSRLIEGMKKNVVKYRDLLPSGKNTVEDFSILTEESERELRVAGLLHDIGHYPFSHVLEKAVASLLRKANVPWNGNHEAMGEQIVLQTEIKDILKENGFKPENITNYITKKEILSFAHNQIVSSVIDADRLDYLLRDAYFTGAKYGQYDLTRLSQIIVPIYDPINQQELIVVHEKGIPTIEQYLTGRFRMYDQVYVHKTVVFFEQAMRDLYEYVTSNVDGIFPHPKTFWKHPENILSFDDNAFFARIREIGDGKWDQDLKDIKQGAKRLARILTQRKIYKAVLNETDRNDKNKSLLERWNAFEREIKDAINNGEIPIGSVILPHPEGDIIRPTPSPPVVSPPETPEKFFKWMEANEEQPTKRVIILTKRGKLKLLTAKNSPGFIIPMIAMNYERHYRVFVDKDYVPIVKRIMKNVFKGRVQLTLDSEFHFH